MLKRIALPLLFLLSWSAFAQSTEFERVLLPISSPEIGGANGSRWVTEHFGRNDGDTPVQYMRDDDSSCGGHACLTTIPPHTTFHPTPSLTKNRVWISIEKSKVNQMFFSTMVRDIGKDIEPWGTEMPSVRESQFRPDKLQLLNVAGGTDFRKNLRVYMIADLTEGSEATLAVRVYDMDAELAATSKRLGEKVFHLTTTKFENGLDYLQVSIDHELPQVQTAQRIRVEVERMSGVPLKLWALLSATNNETQHVTIFTP
ncbi:MAG TPA: hypothetical protein VGQ36_09280 [Thermoanaerobaculia bacterium]|jgi:hypothetical protein|nr:hypothetical protein [Thermoanaerobaculia bacterium]